MKDRLDKLKVREAELRELLSENIKEQSDIRKEDWHKKNSIQLGDDVILGSQKGVLECLNTRYASTIYPKVRFYKLDGTLGKRVVECHNLKTFKKWEESDA